MKIKICGITSIEDAVLCESEGADALGFIFYEKSKRYVNPEAARKISHALSAFTIKVGVFVNSSADEINRIGDIVNLNLIQLHGDESPELANSLRLPAIKAFRVGDNFDYGNIALYPGKYFLLDTYSASAFGGTGTTFAWSKIPAELLESAIIAGGVSEKNVEQIYNELHPWGVDISSSLESAPGKKDTEKVKSFFKTIRNISC